MSVAVVTPWHNHPELAADYMAALAWGIDDGTDELLVVDNGSDPPLEFAAIRNDDNLGFCAASNKGLHAAAADVVVFLNNDIRATAPGWLFHLAAAVDPGVLAGAQLRCDAHANVDGCVMPYLDGWCLAGMRDDLLELGGWDESLAEPAYYSDNLLCLRARAAGMTLRKARGVTLEHICGATSDGDPEARARASAENRAKYVAEVRATLNPVT